MSIRPWTAQQDGWRVSLTLRELFVYTSSDTSLFVEQLFLWDAY